MKQFATLIKQSILIFSLLVSISTARKVKFSVVGFGKDVKVKIGSSSYKLTKYKSHTPLYQATITVSDNALSYKYVVDNIEEKFTRTLAKGTSTTHNEFYGRKDTIKTLPQLPTVYEWNRSIGKGELFDDSYIPTVHINGTRSEKLFTTTKSSADYLEKITFILKDSVYVFKNVPCYPKNKRWNKMQFRVTLGNEGIDGRFVLKFRDNNEDPTFMRQDLYGDIMNALGYPAVQSVKTRVYVNERAVGYYILQEEAASDSFVRAAFHGDNKGNYKITDISKVGQSFDCSTGADFYYSGNSFSAFKPYSEDYDNSRIKKLAKAFNDLNVKNSSEVKNFEKNWFDIDTFFKAVAMQYLTGSIDSYLFDSTNFSMYNDPTESTSSTYKFYFICQDWDYTFGLNLGMPYIRYEDFMNHSYKDFVNISWGVSSYDSKQRYALDKLLSSPTLKARFETILKTIVSKVFNPVVIGKRLDALVERHREEVKWNYDACNVHPLRKGSGTQYNWTIDDFDANISEPAGHGAHYGIKQYVYLRAKLIKKEFNLDLDLGDSSDYEDNIFSTDGTCGADKGKCPSGQCCSKYGYCGTTDAHCGNGCQSEFGKCNKNGTSITSSAKTSTRKTTTTKTTTTKTTTKKTTTKKTATKKTTTKKTSTKKTTTKKTTTKKVTKTTTKKTSTAVKKATKTSTNGKCGPSYGSCPKSQCCSKYGYCGTTSEYCGSGCQKAFGICK